MMSPYGAAEKQALLEAPDLKTRAEILVAVTEIELAKTTTQRRNAAAVTQSRARSCYRSPDIMHGAAMTRTTERPPAASIRSCSKSSSVR